MTPLSATCLLIAFSILLGAIVMSWGRGYIAEKAEFVMGVSALEGGCGSINIGLVKVKGQNLACIRDNQLELMVENRGNTIVEALQLRIMGKTEADTSENVLLKPLGIGDTTKIKLGFRTVKTPVEVRIAPWLSMKDPKELCLQSAEQYTGPFPNC